MPLTVSRLREMLDAIPKEFDECGVWVAGDEMGGGFVEACQCKIDLDNNTLDISS